MEERGRSLAQQVLTRRAAALLAASAAACSTRPEPGLTDQDRRALADIETYLNGITLLQARFAQTGTDGPAAGELWLQRPSLLRIDYDPPQRKTVRAAEGRLTMADLTTGASTELPVADTPLGILLREHVTLSGPIEVASLRRSDGTLQITLVQRDQPRRGALSLDFRQDPLLLYALTVSDASGRVDHLRLSDVVRPTRIDPATFERRPAAATG